MNGFSGFGNDSPLEQGGKNKYKKKYKDEGITYTSGSDEEQEVIRRQWGDEVGPPVRPEDRGFDFKSKNARNKRNWKNVGKDRYSAPTKQISGEKTLKAIDKETTIGENISEGSEKSQILTLKQRCREIGGTWNSSTNLCEGGKKKHELEKKKGMGPRAN